VIRSLCFALLVAAAPGAAAADAPSSALWRDVAEAAIAPGPGQRTAAPSGARTLALDAAGLRTWLAGVPHEASGLPPVVLELPRPDGGFARFAVVESPVMEPGLQARFPEIRTYRGQGLDDAAASVRFALTPSGFHAQVLAPGGRWFVDPWRQGDARHHAAWFARDARPGAPFQCGFDEDEDPAAAAAARVVAPQAASGATLRTYRLALAGTGEYTTAVCAPNPAAVACGLAAMVVSMNRVDGIYESEVAIRMVLVANNSLLVYTDGTSDPYTNGSGSTMLGQNQANLDAVIGPANYDIGHVFSTGGGGVASLNVPCTGSKARGVTGRSNPVGDPFDVDYVAHEMGHQWGGLHTFNGTTSNCGGGNRSASAAYEPGSGSTIMAYAGICGAENLQPHSDPYFHVKSFDQIVAFSTGATGNSCAVATPTGNSAPTVNAGAAYTIPGQMPFALTGSASDPDGDALTYDWEEYDLGTAAPPNTDNGNRPIFRVFDPTVSAARTLPKLSDILSNVASFGESLPTTTRTMTWRLVARDNRSGGGGVDWAATTVTSRADSGPFAITAPNTAGITWAIGSLRTVTWNAANTAAAPVSCANVKLSLSTDGGLSFPTTLLASTPNDGSADVTVPAATTTQARLKAECVGNVFFDVNDQPFAIDVTPVELQGMSLE